MNDEQGALADVPIFRPKRTQELIIPVDGIMPVVQLATDGNETRCRVEVKVEIVQGPVSHADIERLTRRVLQALRDVPDVIELQEGL